MFMYIYMYYTTTCISPCVNNVWTLLCEHPTTNCFFKYIVPCMSMHNASLSTSTSTTLPLAYHHVSPYVNTVWTCIYQLFLETDCNMYVQGQCKCLCTCTCNILLLASEHVQHVWMCAHPCSTLWILYDHVTTCVKVWTMLSSVSLWRCITCSSWWELDCPLKSKWHSLE